MTILVNAIRDEVRPMQPLNNLDTVLAMLQQMESTLRSLQQLRGYVGSDIGEEMLDVVIEDMRAHVAAIKRKLVH